MCFDLHPAKKTSRTRVLIHLFFRTVLDFFALKLRRKRGEFEYVLVAALVFIQRNLLGIRYVLRIQLKKMQDGIEMKSSLVSFHP